MKEKEFRNLLTRAGKREAPLEETRELEKLIAQKEAWAKTKHIDVEKSKNKVDSNLRSNIKFSKKNVPFPLWLKYTASIAILIAFSTTIWLYPTSHLFQSEELVQMIEISTEKGERKTLTLPDGSLIIINAESFVSYPKEFTSKERNLTLKGEAFFKITRDPKRPFIVKSAQITTTVLGTSFNIKESGGNVDVTVTSGKVKVTNLTTQSNILLVKNDQAHYNSKNGNFSQTTATTPKLQTDWSKGILNLNNVSIKDAISELENWYNVNIECNSSHILKCSIKGRYQDKTLNYILEDMKFMLDIDYSYVNDKTILIEE